MNPRRETVNAFRSALRRPGWFAGILTAQALVVFCFDIGRDALWTDELMTWNEVFRQGGLLDMVAATAARHNQPPLYYVLLWFWGNALGTTETLLRLPSAVFMAACVPILYKFGRAAGGPWIAFFACQFFIFCPVSILFAQEARPYALYCLLSLVSLAFLVSILRRDYCARPRHSPTRKGDYAAYGVALFATCLTHPYAVFVGAAHVVIVGVFAVRRRAFALTWLAVLIGVLPVVAVFVDTSRALATSYREMPDARQFLALPMWLVFGPRTWATTVAVALAGLASLLALPKLAAEMLALRSCPRAAVAAWRAPGALNQIAIYGLYALVTLGLPILVTVFWPNTFSRRYFIASLPAMILLGVAVFYLGKHVLRTHVLCGILLALMMVGAARHHSTARGIEWRKAVGFVAEELAQSDAVVLDELVPGSGRATIPWNYYYSHFAAAPHEQLWHWSRRQPAPLRSSLREATVRGLRSREPRRVWMLKGAGGKWDYPPELRDILNRYEMELVASFKGIRVYLGVRRTLAEQTVESAFLEPRGTERLAAGRWDHRA